MKAKTLTLMCVVCCMAMSACVTTGTRTEPPKQGAELVMNGGIRGESTASIRSQYAQRVNLVEWYGGARGTWMCAEVLAEPSDHPDPTVWYCQLKFIYAPTWWTTDGERNLVANFKDIAWVTMPTRQYTQGDE